MEALKIVGGWILVLLFFAFIIIFPMYFTFGLFGICIMGGLYALVKEEVGKRK